jgi:D-alanyl-D-alanine dipeptidase
MWTYDGRRFPAATFPLGTAPAGNLYSTVVDLSQFWLAMFERPEVVLSDASWHAMTHAVKNKDGSLSRFGLGFQIGELDGERKIGHGGAVYGFSTQTAALPEKQISVTIACALDGCNGVLQRLSDHVLRSLVAREAGTPMPEYERSVAVAVERARGLVGRYRNEQGVLDIVEMAGRVYVEHGELRHELRARPSDGTLIVDDLFDYGHELTIDADGRLVYRGETFERTTTVPPVADEPYRGLIGEYGWDHNTLYILERNGQLYALIEWFYYYPLRQLEKDVYAFPDFGLYHGETLKFERDAQGEAQRVIAAEVDFPRREIGTRHGETFRITPVQPIDTLRETALSATPPAEAGDFRATELVELVLLDPTIQLDIRYATTNNFTGSVFYQQPRAFLQRPAAEAVVRAHQKLREAGLGLLIHDAYRPWHVTKMFWDATPDELKDFVANPANGSRHNRGCAVDLTLFDLKTGDPIEMVAGYDEFSVRSYPMYPGGTDRQRWYRYWLRQIMEAEGFSVYEFEWWHFDYGDWRKYRIGNSTFEQLQNSP